MKRVTTSSIRFLIYLINDQIRNIQTQNSNLKSKIIYILKSKKTPDASNRQGSFVLLIIFCYVYQYSLQANTTK